MCGYTAVPENGRTCFSLYFVSLIRSDPGGIRRDRVGQFASLCVDG